MVNEIFGGNKMENLKMHRKIAEGYTVWLQESKVQGGKDLSDSTVKTYVSDLNQFFSKYNAFTRKNIEAFKEEMKDQLSVVSLNRKFSSLKSYNYYLLEKEIIDEMLVKDSDQVDIQSIGNPTPVTEEEVLNFLDAVKKKPSRLKVRNIAMVYLMANTGIRRHEVCNLKLSDIRSSNKGWELYVYGKENKQRRVGLNPVAVKAVENYLKVRNKSKYANSPYLFLSQRGGQLTDSAVNDMFDFYKGDETIHPHALRHNFGTTMIEKKILSPIELQNQMGHKSLTTTWLYTHARQDTILKKIQDAGIGEL